MNKRILVACVFTFLAGSSNVVAQGLNAIKTGVVRIENKTAKIDETGAGFIVKIDGVNVYVVTASHVVRGNKHPKIYFYNRPHDPLTAEVLDREEDDTKGLAILLLKGSRETISGLTTLKLGTTKNLGNADPVKIIGFPGGISTWNVEAGNITRMEGNSLVLSGGIREGNSGGPVILGDVAVGLVTSVNQSNSYASRAEIVTTYLDGIVKGVIDPGVSLRESLIDSLWLEHDTEIEGEAVYLEFESDGLVRTRTPSDRIGYVAANVRWEIRGDTLYVLTLGLRDKLQLEESGRLQGDHIKGKSKNFSTGTTTGWLLTKVSEIPAKDSRPELCQSLTKLVEAGKSDFYPLVGEPNSSGAFNSNYALVGSLSGRVIPKKGVVYRMMVNDDKGTIESRFYTLVSEVRSCLTKWDEKEVSDSSYRYHKFKQQNETAVVEVYYNPKAQRGKHYLLLDVVIPGDGRSEW